jgi:hypothetical protein
VALFSRLLGYVTGHQKEMKGPFALPSWISITLNVLGLLFLLFASITFNFPSYYPVDKDSMNYTSAAIGVVALISLVTWFTTGQKHFTGPGGMSVLHGREEVVRSEAEVEKK